MNFVVVGFFSFFLLFSYSCIFLNQSWKGMIGGDSFVKTGWVHSLRAHSFKTSDGDCWFVMGKV